VEKYVEFVSVSGKPVRVSKRVLRKIITTELSNVFYWMYNPKYFNAVFEFVSSGMNEDALDAETADMVRRYIVHYAENLTLSVYIQMKAEASREQAAAYLKWSLPFLEKLREMYRSRARIWDMIRLCLDHGVDPF